MISARAESLMVTEMVASLRRVGRVEYEGSVQVPLFLLRTARQMAGRRVSCRVHLRLSQQSFGGISRNEAYASDQNATQLPRLNEVVGFRPSDSVDCAELADAKRALLIRPDTNDREILGRHWATLRVQDSSPMYIPIRRIARREFARFCPEAASVLAQTRRWDDADQKRREIVSASGLPLSANGF
jgi:hypothetical protein